MKKSYRTLLGLLAFCPFLVQCASQQEVNTLTYQLRAVNKKLEDMQATTVSEMQKKQASSTGQLNEMQQEILALKGELEATALANQQLQEQNRNLESSLQDVINQKNAETEIKITQLNEQLKQQQDSVATLHEARTLEAERKAKAAADAAEAARMKLKAVGTGAASSTASGVALYQPDRKKVMKEQAGAAKPVPSPPPVPQGTSAAAPVEQAAKPAAAPTPPVPQPQITEQPAAPAQPAAKTAPGDELFTQAQKKFESGNYQGAYEGFEAYLEKNANSPNAVQARYMMGESLYQQKEYDQSILQYQKIITGQPQHAKTPAALLKQAMAFEQLSDKETAKIIYQKIVSSYGSSPEAQQAKAKLSSL